MDDCNLLASKWMDIFMHGLQLTEASLCEVYVCRFVPVALLRSGAKNGCIYDQLLFVATQWWLLGYRDVSGYKLISPKSQKHDCPIYDFFFFLFPKLFFPLFLDWHKENSMSLCNERSIWWFVAKNSGTSFRDLHLISVKEPMERQKLF